MGTAERSVCHWESPGISGSSVPGSKVRLMWGNKEVEPDSLVGTVHRGDFTQNTHLFQGYICPI